MKMCQEICFLLVCLLFSGCVFFDIAAQDTAIPIYPRKISTAVYFSSGVNITDIIADPDEPAESDDDEIGGACMANYKLGFGINKNVDLILNMAQTGGHGNRDGGYRYDSKQLEMGIKYLLKHENKAYYSILPSIYVVKGTHWDAAPEHRRDDVYDIIGAETQVLYTQRANDHISASLIGRASLSNIQRTRFGNNLPTEIIIHGGGRANLSLSWKMFYQTTEIGFEVIPNINDKQKIISIFSAGAGLKF